MRQNNNADKNYLKNGIKISFKTATIGTLEILEQEFGFLWGHGKKEEDLDQDEKYYRSIWEEIRYRIFDRNNVSRDIAISHIDKYTIKRSFKFENFGD